MRKATSQEKMTFYKKVSQFVQQPVLNFFIGLILGLVFAQLFATLSFLHNPLKSVRSLGQNGSYIPAMESVLLRTFLPTSPYEEVDATTVQPINFNDSHKHHDNDDEAKALSRKVRVLCWIMTSPGNLDKKAIHVKKTWGQRCNKLLFFSSVTNETFPVIGLNVSEGRQHLTAKTMNAFQYIYDHFRDEADWFMKADDDTYVIVENLRYFLSSQNTTDPIYFGHRFKVIVQGGYHSGGAGYVLSKEALNRFGTRKTQCQNDGGAEDVVISKCLHSLGVKTGNTTDALGRTRFHCFQPQVHVNGEYPKWFYNFDGGGAKKGLEAMSDYAVSFHYVSPTMMYALEFYTYHLRPYGVHSGNQELNILNEKDLKNHVARKNT